LTGANYDLPDRENQTFPWFNGHISGLGTSFAQKMTLIFRFSQIALELACGASGF
jgi:hypothetical protein